MLTPDQCQKLVAAAFFALPLISVKVIDITLSEGGPAPVSAAQPAAASSLLPLPGSTTQPSPLAVIASAYTEAQNPAAFGPNPFYYIPAAADSRRSAASSAPSSSDLQPPASSLQPSAGDFAVELIMSQPNGDLAVINGQTYCVGQSIGQSPWRLSAVDSRQRSVTLENSQTGQTLTRTVDLRHP